MSKLPTQLKWNLFVRALSSLGFLAMKSKGGSARSFRRGDSDPVTFHEPHGNDTLKQGTLTEYLRKLGITRDELADAIQQGVRLELAANAGEERFRRTKLPDGSMVSNCLNCMDLISGAGTLDIIEAAEAVHVCA